MPKEHELSKQIETARELVEHVKYSKHDLLLIARLTSELQVDGHRADLVILKAARAHAAFEGRDAITERDIALAAELALPHRLKRGPFHQVEVSIDELQSQIEHIQSQVEGEESEQALADDDLTHKKKGVKA
jgi:Mg-chelatase subunit ChlI